MSEGYSKSQQVALGCRKMEEKIAHYREMASYVMDQPTLDGIGALVARLEEEKRVQHPKT